MEGRAPPIALVRPARRRRCASPRRARAAVNLSPPLPPSPSGARGGGIDARDGTAMGIWGAFYRLQCSVRPKKMMKKCLKRRPRLSVVHRLPRPVRTDVVLMG